MKNKVNKRITFATGLKELSNLVDGPDSLFDTSCISESLCDMFMDSGHHIWDSWYGEIVDSEFEDIEFLPYAKKSHYEDGIKEDIKRAMSGAYSDSLESAYYESLKSHMESTIESMEHHGFEAQLVDNNLEPCEFYEARYIQWALSKKAYLNGFQNDYEYSLKDFIEQEAGFNIDCFIDDLDKLNWYGLNHEGDSEKWKIHYGDYAETKSLAEDDKRIRDRRVKSLIKNSVPLAKRVEVLQRDFAGIFA